MTFAIGLNTTNTYTADELRTSGKGFGLGDRVTDHAGKDWVFILAGGAIGQYDVAVFDEVYGALALSTSNDARGDLVGVAPSAIASGSYGWLQVYGPATMNVLASCAANARLNTTATAGSLDDDGTSTTFSIDGVVLTTARAASNGSAPAILNYPQIGAVI